MPDPIPRAAGTEFTAAVIGVISRIPAGDVSTYGEVAREAGYPGAARAVGHVLAAGADVPWWRVVAANGRLVPGHEAEHRRRLVAEGVELADGRVRWPRTPSPCGRAAGTGRMERWTPST